MRWLVWTAVAAVIVQLPLALLLAPAAENFNAPLTQRILYYHVPAAWVAYLAFVTTAVCSLLVLLRDDPRADRVAVASAEVGMTFGLVALVTGLIWATQEFFGYSAIEDPKVITLGVLLAAYLGYFALRANLEESKRARLAAVFGLLCVLGVPLSYLASRASVHPDFTRPEESLDWRLGVVLLYSTAAFTLLAAVLVAMRVRLLRLEERIAR